MCSAGEMAAAGELPAVGGGDLVEKNTYGPGV